MFEIITTILFIIFVSVALIVFFRMRKQIKHYRALNEDLKAENEDLKQHQGFKTCKIELPPHYMSEIPFETYKATIELPLYDFIHHFNREVDTTMKEQVTRNLIENLVIDKKISFTVEEDMYYNTALITATIRIVK